MKQINEMNEEELVSYFVDKYAHGWSIREIVDSFNRFDVPQEARTKIQEKIQVLDMMVEKEEYNQAKQIAKRKSIKYFGIGIFVIVFGIILYKYTSIAGKIAIIEIPIMLYGLLCIAHGIGSAIKAVKG